MGFKILLTEHQSPIGSALLKGFELQSLPVISADPLDPEELRRLLEQSRPTIVVDSLMHCDLEWQADFHTVGQVLADFCRDYEVALIHLSSHEVFGAAQQGSAALERDRPEPDGAAGQMFFAAEQALLSCERKVILRLPWLLDTPGGLLDRLCHALIYTQECVVSDSWRGSPVFIDDVVRIVLAVVQQILCGAENWGYFHLHASDHCSEAELADHVARILQKAGYEVCPILLGGLEQRFIKSNGWLKGARCTNNFGFQYRSWRQGVKNKVYEWLEAEIAAGRLAPAVPA